MSQRSKNLLEAFNQSKAPEKSAEPVAPPRGSAPKVGGPFADSAPMARPKEQPLLHGARSDSSRSPRERLRVVVLCTGIAVIFFFVGRASAPSVGAAAVDRNDYPAAAIGITFRADAVGELWPQLGIATAETAAALSARLLGR